MTTTATTSTTSERPLLRQGWDVSPSMVIFTLVSVTVLAISTVGRIFDDTLVNGVSAWDKPLKFALSFMVFGPLLLWLYSKVDRTRVIGIGLAVVAWSLILEIVLIALQAARGVPSHYNQTTALNAAIFQAMAAGVGVFTVAAVVIGFVLARRNLGSGPMALAMKLAVPVMTVGAVSGFAMTRPRAEQLEAESTTLGAHSFGGEDGGPGLPFLGWSTEHGDGRVAHFLGLHALHVIPLIALLVSWLARRGSLTADSRGQWWITLFGSLSYVGLAVTTFVQALRGQSVVAPDAATLLTLAALSGIPLALALSVALATRARGDRTTV